MTTQISFQKNDWTFHAGPWFRPFLFWQTNPNIWTFWLWNFEHRWCIFHFILDVKQILRLLLVLRNLAIWRWYPWSWRLSFVTQTNLALWIRHKSLNHLLQRHLGVQLGLDIFEISDPTLKSWDDRCPLMTKKCTVLTSFQASAITSFLFLTSASFHAGNFSSFSHSIASSIGINLCTKF